MACNYSFFVQKSRLRVNWLGGIPKWLGTTQLRVGHVLGSSNFDGIKALMPAIWDCIHRALLSQLQESLLVEKKGEDSEKKMLFVLQLSRVSPHWSPIPLPLFSSPLKLLWGFGRARSSFFLPYYSKLPPFAFIQFLDGGIFFEFFLSFPSSLIFFCIPRRCLLVTKIIS